MWVSAGEVTDLGGDNVVWNNVGHQVEPEDRKLVKNLSLLRDAFIHDDIESGETIGGHDQQMLAKIVDVADFAAIDHVSGQACWFRER